MDGVNLDGIESGGHGPARSRRESLDDLADDIPGELRRLRMATEGDGVRANRGPAAVGRRNAAVAPIPRPES